MVPSSASIRLAAWRSEQLKRSLGRNRWELSIPAVPQAGTCQLPLKICQSVRRLWSARSSWRLQRGMPKGSSHITSTWFAAQWTRTPLWQRSWPMVPPPSWWIQRTWKIATLWPSSSSNRIALNRPQWRIWRHNTPTSTRCIKRPTSLSASSTSRQSSNNSPERLSRANGVASSAAMQDLRSSWVDLPWCSRWIATEA